MQNILERLLINTMKFNAYENKRITKKLTILQAKSVGLEVTLALPIFPLKDPENCDNPEELETVSPFGFVSLPEWKI